jgi:prepilin-type N-terminal cleavage/methylation domain-containing protein
MLGSRDRGKPVLLSQEAGFTLVEVVVASAVLGLIMVSSGLFFLGGLRSIAGLQHRQAATSLAAQAMELATSISALPDSSGCVPLLYGRPEAAVTSQWASPPGVDLSGMDAAWNAETCPSTVAVPLSGLTTTVADGAPAVTLGGVGYTVRTFIGSCHEPRDGGACVRQTPNNATNPKMFRIVVVVGWAGADCPSSGCRYSVGTLLSAAADRLFNLRSEVVPTAVDDVVCTSANTGVLASLLANDTGPLGPSPLTVVSAPAHGNLTGDPSTGIGIYTPMTGYVGLDSFTYRLTGSSGAQSATATVTVKIGIAC